MSVTTAIVALGDFLRHAGRIVGRAVRATPKLTEAELRGRLFAYGVATLPIVALASVCVGMALGLHTSRELARVGLPGLAAEAIAVAMVREFGPVFTALLVAGRAGAGLAAELGSLTETGQIRAMRALGIDADRELLAPRLVAVVLSTVVLTVYADLIGILGGMATATGGSVTAAGYIAKVVSAIDHRDLALSLGKAAAFGGVIGLVGVHFGLRDRGPTGSVGRDTMRAVVWSSVAILFLNLTITRLV